MELAPGLEVALDLRGGLSAIARNALAQFDDSPLAPHTTIKLNVAGVSLAHDGCDFIEGTHLFLAVRDCPEDAQSFVLALAGMSGGNAEDYFKATDEQIAARLNCSTRHVIRKRKSLKEWSQASGFAVVQIKEGNYDKATGKYQVTEYRVPVVAVAEAVVKWARQNQNWTRSPSTAKSQAAEKQLQGEIDARAKELPVETVVKARKRKKAKVEERESSDMAFTKRRNKLAHNLKKLMKEADALSYDPRDVWRRLQTDIESYLTAEGF